MKMENICNEIKITTLSSLVKEHTYAKVYCFLQTVLNLLNTGEILFFNQVPRFELCSTVKFFLVDLQTSAINDVYTFGRFGAITHAVKFRYIDLENKRQGD